MMFADANTGSSSLYHRFCVQLFIVHPSMEPLEITNALDLEPKISRQVGEPRTTPKGDRLPGRYRDTRWRYSKEYNVNDQRFVAQLEALMNHLEPRKKFLNQLSATGGSATVIIQFLGDDGHFGDSLPQSMLKKIGDLGLDLGIEVYTLHQSTNQ